MNMNRKILVGLLILGMVIVPSWVKGEEIEIRYMVLPFSTFPKIIDLGQEFEGEFLLDWEGNEAAQVFYNQTNIPVRLDFNITLSDGLKWSWQSQTQSLVFWVTIKNMFGLSSVTIPRLFITTIKTGFQTILIQLDPEIGKEYHTELGLWVMPKQTAPTLSRVGLLLQNLAPVWIMMAFFVGLVLGSWGNEQLRKREREEEET